MIIKFFRKIGMELTNADPYIIAYIQGNIFILVRVYINKFLLGSQSQDRLEWLKDQLMKEFNIKDLSKTKIIIRWDIIQNLQARTLKIDKNGYTCNLLEAKEMSLCHQTVFLGKAGSALFLGQARDQI